MAPFEIACPACRARFDCPVERAGRSVRCGACANVFTAPPPVPVAVALPLARPRPAVRVATATPVARATSAVAARYDSDDDDAPRRRRPAEVAVPKTSPLVYALGGVGGLLLLVVLAFAGFALKRQSDAPAVAVAPKVEVVIPAVQPLSAAPAAPALPAAPAGVPPAPAGTPPPKVAATLPNGTPAQAIQMVKASTAYIRTRQKNMMSMGSGFFAGPPGYVVTNAHVIGVGPKDVQMPSRVEVVVHSGEADQKVYTARIVGASVDDDLALLWINGADHNGAALPPPLTFGRTADLVETQEVVIFGFPLGEQLGLNISVNKTTVSSLRKQNGVVELVQVADGMTHGNSGGPVTNTRGEVIGVVVAGIEGTPINFAIPGDKGVAFLARQATSGGNFEMGRLAHLRPKGVR